MQQEEITRRPEAGLRDANPESAPRNGSGVPVKLDPMVCDHGLMARDFHDLGAAAPRLERAIADGWVSVLVAGRGRTEPTAQATLQREYAFRNALHEDWAALPLALVPHGEGALLVLKDPGGELLRRMDCPVRSIDTFIAVAIRLTAAAAAMHAAGVMHRALTPDRVLLTPDGRARLTGFGFASRIATENDVLPEEHLAWDEISFDYMAPELGGRMNVRVDARADLYSLGCILHELLVGRPPFQGADPAQRVHAHATHKPSPPSDLVEGIPRQLSLLILKLLEKTREHRYDSAASVLADLHRCETLYRQHGSIPHFALDAQALLRRVRYTDQVLGRDAELETLVSLYRQTASDSRSRVAWVSGPSGIGKSILLREAVARIRQSGSPLVAAGKCDEGTRGQPYAILVQALEQLLQFVLGCPEEEFATWQDRIRAATTAVDRTLAGFLPALPVVLGAQPAATETPDASAVLERERVRQGMARLLACFATATRPLVLLLDDLQWADVGALEVLERLLHQHAGTPLLLVGTFRSNEVDADHPLRADRLAEVPASVKLELGPLDERALRELIAQALQQDADGLGPLTDVVGRKTQRNPFFTQHLLGLLAHDGLLSYDAGASAWRWSLERITAHPAVDNVVDLLVRRFEELPAPTQSALQLLAFLGQRASGETLAVAAGLAPDARSIRSLEATLEPAFRAGTLCREDDDWVFCHDRFREATYASVAPADRASLHLQIARRQSAHPTARAHVFAIAAQANLARSAVDALQERRDFAKLNLEAGRQAKAATAHHSALGFFRAALDFLGADDVTEEGLNARASCGEAEFLTGNLEAAEARLSALEQVAGDGVFGADLARLRAALYTTLGRFDLALAVGLSFLRKAGIHVPMRPDDAAVDREYTQLRTWLDRHGILALRRLPIAVDPLRLAITNIFCDLIPPALYTDQNLVDLILLRMANLGIVHGHTDASANGYVCMTQVFGVRYGDYGTAREFGALALHLVDERGLRLYRGRVYMAYGTMVVPWTQPARAARDFIRRAYQVLVNVADHTFAIYCGANEASGLLFSGEFLGNVRDTVEHGLTLARDANFQFVVNALLAQKVLLARLQDGTDGHLPEPPSVPQEGASTTLVDFEYWVYRLQGALLSGDLPDALEARRRAQACASAGRTFAESGELPFYGALALLALPVRDPDQQAALHRDVAQLAAWAEVCPDNFSARFDLVRAELARVGGEPLQAAEAYVRSVSHARRHGFTQIEALAAELAAAFHTGRGDELSAQGNLRHARGAWQRWGAAAKVRQLQAAHPAVFEQDAWPPAASRLQALDAQAVLRISTALASDIVPARLIETVLRTALESAGAERGTLALLRHGVWQVRAQARVLDGAIPVTQEVPAFGSEILPVSIVQAVARTQQCLVVGDAREEPSLAQDHYVRVRRPRSVLCVPMMRHATLIGALYLENNLAAQVFTLAKAELLEVIASQAAFALENARLYDELLDQNRQRAVAEEQLRGALAELERASRLKAMGELVASIVHEIGQPIAAVDTSASAALRWLDRSTPDIDEARQMLAHISKSALRARTIIQSLRSKARNAEPQFAPFDLGEALREAATLVAGPLESLGVALELQGLDAPVQVRGDRVQLQQVAVNLLMNGAEAMTALEHGPRLLRFACATDDEGRAQVAVDDVGSGIGAGTADKLLQPLFTTKANGMGMGLAICKSILDAHGGTLALLPRKTAGTRAVFSLPRLDPGAGARNV